MLTIRPVIGRRSVHHQIAAALSIANAFVGTGVVAAAMLLSGRRVMVAAIVAIVRIITTAAVQLWTATVGIIL